MTTLYTSETYINAGDNTRFGESEIEEAHTDDVGRLYRSLMAEYGRCVSKVYQDTKSRGTIAIGWVFKKRMQYEGARDPKDTYIREVWATVYEACELNDPLALRRNTRFGEEVIRMKYKVLP